MKCSSFIDPSCSHPLLLPTARDAAGGDFRAKGRKLASLLFTGSRVLQHLHHRQLKYLGCVVVTDLVACFSHKRSTLRSSTIFRWRILRSTLCNQAFS